MNKYLKIDGGYHIYKEVSFLKGFSIITIVLMHLIQSNSFSALPFWIGKGASLGGTGVHVFFFCSGFGLWLSYSKKRVGWLEFIKTRFFKIYIPYIIIVVITFLWHSIKNNNFDEIGALLSHIFLYKMFIPQYEETLGYFWFLSTLFQFYFMFIPICMFKNKFGNKTFMIFSLSLSVVWWMLSSFLGFADERIWGSFFLQYLWEFSLGMIIGDYIIHNREIKISNIILLIISIIGISMEGVLSLWSNLKAFNDVPAFLGYASLALLFFQIKPFKKTGEYVSNFSYEVYLVHGLVFSLFYYFFHSNNLIFQIVLGLVALILSFFVGYLYHRLITLAKKQKERSIVNGNGRKVGTGKTRNNLRK